MQDRDKRIASERVAGKLKKEVAQAQDASREANKQAVAMKKAAVTRHEQRFSEKATEGRSLEFAHQARRG
eukprot:COSAG02_NODE_6734_length_3394_cov_2.435508_1_plen_70_part_00